MKDEYNLQKYLDKHFSNLKIRPDIFWYAPIAIRFRLGTEEGYDKFDSKENMNRYMKQVYSRSQTLFKQVHSDSDEIFLLVYAHRNIRRPTHKKLKIFSNYIKDKKIVHRFYCEELPYFYQDEYDAKDMRTYCSSLFCNVSDVKYNQLLKASANQDMGVFPRITDPCFFINITKHTIFYLYDDRGLDIIAESRDTLEDLYVTFNDWIDEDEREKVASVFKSYEWIENEPIPSKSMGI